MTAASADPYPRNRATGSFERRVARTLLPHVEEGERILVAASGGPDSTALLVAAARVLGSERVVAAHFDHRLRAPEESAADHELVRNVSSALGVELAAGRAGRAPRDRGEEAAREARYRWLARACREAGIRTCATGHTLDDQAETVLLRLVRGAGGGGAAGIAPVAPWPVPGRGTRALRVVRPLLDLTRPEVERYLGALAIRAAHDVLNDDPRYARVRVRRRVLPELRAINPRASKQIARFAARQRADDEALEAWAAQELARIGQIEPGCVAIERRALTALPEAVAARCLRLAAERVGAQLDGAQVEALLRAARRRGQHVALGGAAAETDGAMLRLRRARTAGLPPRAHMC